MRGLENLIFFTVLSFKRGVVPFHSWFFYVASKVDIFVFFLVRTTQKIIPLQFFFIVEIKFYIILILSLRALISSLVILIINYNIYILIISSCIIITWIITARILSLEVTWEFFFLYSIILILLIFFVLKRSKFREIREDNFNIRKSVINVIILVFYTGIPPRPLFFIKILVIISLIENGISGIRIVILSSSIISIYSYLSILFSTLQCYSISWSESNLNYIKVNWNIIYMIIITLVISILIFI